MHDLAPFFDVLGMLVGSHHTGSGGRSLMVENCVDNAFFKVGMFRHLRCERSSQVMQIKLMYA